MAASSGLGEVFCLVVSSLGKHWAMAATKASPSSDLRPHCDGGLTVPSAEM